MTLFQRARWRYVVGEIEFGVLASILANCIEAEAENLVGFSEVKREFGFHVERTGPHSIQASFGNRAMWERNPDMPLKTPSERGAALVYSFGPTGGLMVALYPCSSDIGTWKEQTLIWHQGKFSAIHMQSRLKTDLRDLAAYCRVTSLDAEAGLSDGLRIAWLGITRHRQVDGKFVRARARVTVGEALISSSDAVRSAFLEVLLKPIVVLTIAFTLALLGNHALLGLVQGAIEVAEKLEIKAPQSAAQVPSQHLVSHDSR